MTIFAVVVIIVAGISLQAKAEPVPMDRLGRIGGILTDPSGVKDTVLLATRIGILAGKPDGLAVPVSSLNNLITALTVDPQNTLKLFASGQSEKDGNLGVQTSDDGGKTWKKISDGANGPVVFQSLAVSPKNPNVLYGAGKDLQVSRDGGVNWTRVGSVPEKLFSIAASTTNENMLYAATMAGLLVSRDGGVEWLPANVKNGPATMVYVSPEGRVFAFVYGSGLITAQEPGMDWKVVAEDFQDRVLMGMAISDDDPKRLYAYADTGRVMISNNSGQSWSSLEGSDKANEQTVSKGRKLFEDNCAACHGERGIGERPDDPNAKDEYGFVAPALNNDAHGWHHPDMQIIETILNGSPRNERMIAWKEQLSRQEAEQLVAYIKSLWNFRSLACQGSRHMTCMR
ncbi:MAG: c-type cytochrome [Rhodospirillales bacterium]|nr:c-type cytochrome [Rhodospirillales bacterium]